MPDIWILKEITREEKIMRDVKPSVPGLLASALV
jgi:hypothetical protein